MKEVQFTSAAYTPLVLFSYYVSMKVWSGCVLIYTQREFYVAFAFKMHNKAE